VKRFARIAQGEVLRIEFCPMPDAPGKGMTGSGMLVINPPWGLAERMSALLPHMVKMTDLQGHYQLGNL
jgi:23S rRNA (adenine2030-N6)-methyltransferase